MMDTILRWLAICATVVVSLAFLSQESLKQWRCARNLERIGSMLKENTYQNGGYYAPLSKMPGRLMFGPDSFDADMRRGAYALISHVHPEREALEQQLGRSPASLYDDQSYWYLGYAFANEGSALAWIDDYKRLVPQGFDIPDSLPTDGKHVSDIRKAPFDAPWYQCRSRNGHFRSFKIVVYARLKDGVENVIGSRFDGLPSETFSAKKIPVLIERPKLHGDGGHVLFMDGHVEFMPYPGEFPMTQDFIEGLESLDRLEHGVMQRAS